MCGAFCVSSTRTPESYHISAHTFQMKFLNWKACGIPYIPVLELKLFFLAWSQDGFQSGMMREATHEKKSTFALLTGIDAEEPFRMLKSYYTDSKVHFKPRLM